MDALLADLLYSVHVDLTLFQSKHSFLDPHVASFRFFLQPEVVLLCILVLIVEVHVVYVNILGALNLYLHISEVLSVQSVEGLHKFLRYSKRLHF